MLTKKNIFSGKIYDRILFLCLIILSTGFVLIFYGNILLSPNSFQFSTKGDAIKNYYTYAYYIKNNTETINFEGLNYPYGEHFLYTDCTPVLSGSLKIISNYYPQISNYSIGILNFLLIISLIFSSILVYLIFKEYGINYWLSIFSAIAIIALSPQIFRLTGHLALGFGFIIPLSWYLLIRYEKDNNGLKYGIYLLISTLIIFFIHAYLGMIVAAFLFSYAIVRFISEYRKGINIKYYWNLLTIIFTPIIIFRAFVFFTDTHYGRTNNPWGFFDAYANFNSVFLPIQKPLKPIVQSIIGNYEQIWEGWAYIGIGSIIVIICYLALIIKKSLNNKKIILTSKYFDNKQLQNIVIASILLLIFSMAYPFRLKMEWLLDYVAVLKQFRAVGRFAWVFFFAVTISSVYFVDRISKQLLSKNSKLLAIALMVLLPGLYFAEAVPYHIKISKKIENSKNLFNYDQLDGDFKEALQQIKTEDFQAILPMPFFYIGSENFGKFGSDKIYLLTQLSSYHTGLGIIGSYLTRTSIWESKNIMQLMSPSFYKKEIQKDLPNNRKILIISSHDNISKYEQRVINISSLIFKADNFSFYELNLNDLFESSSVKEVDKFNTIKDNLFVKDNFLVNDSSNFLYYNNFDSRPSEVSLSGEGAFSGFKKNFNTLASFDKSTFNADRSYIATFWIYNNGDNYGQDMVNSMFILQEKDGDNSAWSKIVNPAYSMVINENWSLVEMEFKLKFPDSQVTFLLKGNNLHKNKIYIDDFMIYEKGSLNYRQINIKGNQILIKNNHHIK